MAEMDKLSKEFKFSGALEEDKVLLLSMIDDPVKTFRAYNMETDDKTLRVLDGIAADVRRRAIELFRQAGVDEACQHCQCCGMTAAPMR